MVTLRVVRHDRHDQVLAECQSTVLPVRGEVLQLDTIGCGRRKVPAEHDVAGRVGHAARAVVRVATAARRSTAVASSSVEVAVLPDVALVPEFAAAAEQILSESKM